MPRDYHHEPFRQHAKNTCNLQNFEPDSLQTAASLRQAPIAPQRALPMQI